MSYLVRSILMIAGASVLAAVRVEAPPNVLEVVVNGPHAGTYKQASEVACMHVKKERSFASCKNLTDIARSIGGSLPPPRDKSHEIFEAAIKVSNRDDPGAKFGEVRIAFGDPDKKPIRYTVDPAPLTLTIQGKGADIAFQGNTKDGIQLRVTANCSDVEEM